MVDAGGGIIDFVPSIGLVLIAFVPMVGLVFASGLPSRGLVFVFGLLVGLLVGLDDENALAAPPAAPPAPLPALGSARSHSVAFLSTGSSHDETPFAGLAWPFFAILSRMSSRLGMPFAFCAESLAVGCAATLFVEGIEGEVDADVESDAVGGRPTARA